MQNKKIALMICGIDEMMPELMKPIRSMKSIDDSFVLMSSKDLFPDVYIREEFLHSKKDIKGYVCIAEENCYGDVLCYVEPICNGQFLDSSEAAIIALNSSEVPVIDCTLAWYDIAKQLYYACDNKILFAANVHANAIKLMKESAKEYFWNDCENSF